MKLLMKIYFLIEDQKPRSRTSSKIVEIFCYENFLFIFPEKFTQLPHVFYTRFHDFEPNDYLRNLQTKYSGG